MISEITDALQRTNSFPSMLMGMYSYFATNMNSYKRFMSNVANLLDGSMDDRDDRNDDDIAVVECVRPRVGYIRFMDVRNAIVDMNITNKTSDEVTVTIYNQNDTPLSGFTLTQAVDYLRDNMSVTNGLLATLGAASDLCQNTVTDFLSALQLRLDSLSVCADTQSAIKSSVIALSQNVGNIDVSSIEGVLPGLLSIFGIYSSKVQLDDVPAASYTGVNPYNVILSDGLQWMQDLGDTIAHNFENFCGGIGYALWSIVDNTVVKFGKWIAKWIFNIAGVSNAILPLDNHGGDGSLAVNYTYHYPNTLGSWQLTYLDNCFANIDSDTITGLLPVSTLMIKKNESGYDLTLFPKVLNYEVVRTAFLKNFPGWDVYACLPWASETTYGHMVKGSSNFDFGSVTIEQCCKLINDIFSTNELFTPYEFATDAGLLEGVYWSKFLTVLLAYLYEFAMNSDPEDWNVNTSFKNLVSIAKNCQFTDYGSDPNIQTGSGGVQFFEPANYEALMVACSLQDENTAFFTGYTGGTYTPGYNVQTVSSSQYTGLIDAFAIIAKWCYGYTSVRSGIGVFTPYLTTAVSPKPSFYVPSDTDNVDIAKSFLSRSVIIAGTAIVAIGAFSIFRTLKQKSFALSARAGSLSWKAAETGDEAIMISAYKLNKKANLLARLSFYAGDVASNSANQLTVKPLLTQTANNITQTIDDRIVQVGQLIDTNFE